MAIALEAKLIGEQNVGMEVVAVLPSGEIQNGFPSYFVLAVSPDKEHAITWQCAFVPYLVCVHSDHNVPVRLGATAPANSCPYHKQRHLETRHDISYFWGHNFHGTAEVTWEEPPTELEKKQMYLNGRKRFPKLVKRTEKKTAHQRAFADLVKRAGINPYYLIAHDQEL